ncbi:MAG: hypothetical protein AAGG02_21520 [Cyanobacteria bacterium P01_H01_bin.15]
MNTVAFGLVETFAVFEQKRNMAQGLPKEWLSDHSSFIDVLKLERESEIQHELREIDETSIEAPLSSIGVSESIKYNTFGSVPELPSKSILSNKTGSGLGGIRENKGVKFSSNSTSLVSLITQNEDVNFVDGLEEFKPVETLRGGKFETFTLGTEQWTGGAYIVSAALEIDIDSRELQNLVGFSDMWAEGLSGIDDSVRVVPKEPNEFSFLLIDKGSIQQNLIALTGKAIAGNGKDETNFPKEVSKVNIKHNFYSAGNHKNYITSDINVRIARKAQYLGYLAPDLSINGKLDKATDSVLNESSQDAVNLLVLSDPYTNRAATQNPVEVKKKDKILTPSAEKKAIVVKSEPVAEQLTDKLTLKNYTTNKSTHSDDTSIQVLQSTEKPLLITSAYSKYDFRLGHMKDFTHIDHSTRIINDQNTGQVDKITRNESTLQMPTGQRFHPNIPKVNEAIRQEIILEQRVEKKNSRSLFQLSS